MNKIFIASNNAHKISEIREILKNHSLDIEILSPASFSDDTEPEENGKTYAENAYIKAKYYYDKYHYPTLADDSGISIRFLNNQPNIHSARFLSSYSANERNCIICEVMKYAIDRYACFETVICFIHDDVTEYFSGKAEGEIAMTPMGEKGFGYDPIFYKPEYGKTMGELGEVVKNQISHRALALDEWVRSLEK